MPKPLLGGRGGGNTDTTSQDAVASYRDSARRQNGERTASAVERCPFWEHDLLRNNASRLDDPPDESAPKIVP